MLPRQPFLSLTTLLAEWRPLWQPLPFQHRVPPWQGRFPELIQDLLALTDTQVERLQADPFGASPLTDRLPVEELRSLVALPLLEAGGEALPLAWAAHVGGRKWCQIEAFLSRLHIAPQQPLVEWCAGKGHLARLLSRRHGAEVTGLEWQASLCRVGHDLASRQGARVRLLHQDVMAGETAQTLSPGSHLLALHACGDLHARLLEVAVEKGCDLTLAPCCYHRSLDEHYRPLSRLGRELAEKQGLSLSREDLALAARETVTAPRGVRRARERASAWRLGFDALQRELRGVDDYLPVPSLAYGRLPASFTLFCGWAAERKGLVLPEGIDWRTFEGGGWQRLADVARLEMIRHLFRRPLEVWLALDRLAFLEEAGFEVELGIFCARQVTPRNLLIRASAPRLARTGIRAREGVSPVPPS
jgi:hypothetical protein